MVWSGLLTLSDMIIVGPRRCNPNIHKAEALVQDICIRNNIKAKTYDNYTTMSPFVFSRTSTKRLLAIDLLINFAFYVDDDINDDRFAQQDDYHRRILKQCVEIFMTGKMPQEEHKFFPVALEMHHMFIHQTTPTYFARLAKALGRYLKATTSGIDIILDINGKVDLQKYIYFREHLSGMLMTVDLTEFAFGIEVPEEVRLHPHLYQMYRNTSQIGCLSNDIFSYHKEVNGEGTRANLVKIYMDNENLSFEEGLHRAVTHVNSLISSFLDLEATLPTWEDDNLNQLASLYVLGMRDIITAAWHWQATTNRYRDPESPIQELRQVL